MDPETGRISPFWEIVAGGTAGGCQVVSAKLSIGFSHGKISRCCVGFHKPTGNRVCTIMMALYEHRAHMKDLQENPITSSRRSSQSRRCSTTRRSPYHPSARACWPLPGRVGVLAARHPIFGDIFPSIFPFKEGRLSRRISRKKTILF